MGIFCCVYDDFKAASQMVFFIDFVLHFQAFEITFK